MSVVASLGIGLISVLILASMKLMPGVFSLFYHYASGKYPEKKVTDLTIFFFFGVEAFILAIFSILNLLTFGLFKFGVDFGHPIFSWIISGIIIALAISFVLFYYRQKKTTELFITRKTAHNYANLAKNVKNKSDAFVLGFISGVPELIFTAPLYLIILFELTKNLADPIICAILLLICALIIAFPAYFTFFYFKADNNLARLQKLRIKNKSFFKFFVFSLYLLLAILIITFRIID